MSRAGLKALARLSQPMGSLAEQSISPAARAALQQVRHGMGGVPEYWGQKSKYTEGTDFLGTPTNHMELVRKRPLSPDVFDIDGRSTHYHFQPNALSSIANRVTGVVLSFGAAGIAGASLAGCLPAALGVVKSTPLLLYPAKGAVSFVLAFHYLGGLRHFAWDHGKIGKQVDHKDLLQLDKVQKSSVALFGAAAVAAAAGMFYHI